VQTLSRELTYALAAPRSMFTETGKKLAREHAAKTVAFYDGLLDDLETWGIASFERRVIILEEDFRTRDGACVRSMEATIVMPRACPDCEAPLGLTHRRGRGVKCEKLTARFACARCDYARETSFCLPVLASCDSVPASSKRVDAQAGRQQQIQKSRPKAAVLP